MNLSCPLSLAVLLLPCMVQAESGPGKPAAKRTYTKKQLAALNSRSSVPELQYDTNLNGKLDPSEISTMSADINKRAAIQMKRQEEEIVSTAPELGIDPYQPHTEEGWKELLATSSNPDADSSPTHFRARSTVSDFSKSENDISIVSPAVFSYSRDFLSKSDSWTARGAVGGYWERDWANISLGTEFDRLDTEAPEEMDVDALTFRALLNKDQYLRHALLDTISWNFGASYATNFDFDGGLLGATGELELLWNHKAFTGAWVAGSGQGPALTLRNFIRAEGGGTVDDFPDAAARDDEYLRVGPHLDVLFWPYGYSTNPPLRLKAGYGYMWELLGEGPDFKNFSAGVELRLDKVGHYFLTLEYINGRVPFLMTDRESLLLSLGIRF